MLGACAQCDYSSVPQKHSPSQEAAISSLGLYASIADALVIVAPETMHLGTRRNVDYSTYNQRMWCRAEQFCYVVRKGAHDVWLATSATVAPTTVNIEWLSTSLMVCARRSHGFARFEARQEKGKGKINITAQHVHVHCFDCPSLRRSFRASLLAAQ